MRLLSALVIVCVVSVCPAIASAQATPYPPIVDVAAIDHSGGVSILTVAGWAVWHYADLTASIYINDVYISSGIGQPRGDVCANYKKANLPCGMNLNKPCAIGSFVVASEECVGLIRVYNISAWTSGVYEVKICMLHAATTYSPPMRVCSAGKPFTKP